MAASELLQKQWRFASMVGQLLCYATANNIRVAGREWWRTAQQALWYFLRGCGIRNSVHCVGLALDLCVYSEDGKYLTDIEFYRALGEYWESLGGSWGGRFKDSKGRPKPDAGHFSLEYAGRR